jgi:hypothetical protein
MRCCAVTSTLMRWRLLCAWPMLHVHVITDLHQHQCRRRGVFFAAQAGLAFRGQRMGTGQSPCPLKRPGTTRAYRRVRLSAPRHSAHTVLHAHCCFLGAICLCFGGNPSSVIISRSPACVRHAPLCLRSTMLAFLCAYGLPRSRRAQKARHYPGGTHCWCARTCAPKVHSPFSSACSDFSTRPTLTLSLSLSLSLLCVFFFSRH